MIAVRIASTNVRRMTGNAKVGGKPYDLSFQEGWFFFTDKDGKPEPYPTKVEFILPKDKDGAALFYPEGDYQLHPSSLYVDRTGNVAVAPRLVAIQRAPKAAA
jgi:hypothetical protein